LADELVEPLFDGGAVALAVKVSRAIFSMGTPSADIRETKVWHKSRGAHPALSLAPSAILRNPRTHVADHHQRRARPAHQQRHRAWRVPGREQ
jgi:hypothetical protein